VVEEHTTAVVQRYLDELAGLEGNAPAEPVIRELMERAAGRLRTLCATLLLRGYPRLAKPPFNVETDEMLGAVAERLLKAMREVRPTTVRQFFALANRHMRWELNGLARQLDERTPPLEFREGLVAAPESSGSAPGPNARRMLSAIEQLPDDEREVFDLVRIQGMPQIEAAKLLGISSKTVQRRLNRGLVLLAQELSDLRPAGTHPT
jgi:RNA polymerase sigma-70 factor (ECF subfamily)